MLNFKRYFPTNLPTHARIKAQLDAGQSVALLSNLDGGQMRAILDHVVYHIQQNSIASRSPDPLDATAGPTALIVVPHRDMADELTVVLTELVTERYKLEASILTLHNAHRWQEGADIAEDVIITTSQQLDAIGKGQRIRCWRLLRCVVLTEADFLLLDPYHRKRVMRAMRKLDASSGSYLTVLSGAPLGWPEKPIVYGQMIQVERVVEFDFQLTKPELELVDLEFYETPCTFAERFRQLRDICGPLVVTDRFTQNKRLNPVIIYAATQKRQRALVEKLREGLPSKQVVDLQRDMNKERAARIMQDFERTEDLVVVTHRLPVFGFRFTKPPVVIQFDVPKSVDTWRKQALRTNVMGRRGRCVTFFDLKQKADRRFCEGLSSMLQSEGRQVPTFMQDVHNFSAAEGSAPT